MLYNIQLNDIQFIYNFMQMKLTISNHTNTFFLLNLLIPKQIHTIYITINLLFYNNIQ